MLHIRNRIRLARKIHAGYQSAASKEAYDLQTGWSRLEHLFEMVRDQRESVQKARDRGWHFAAEQQQDQFTAILESLSRWLRELQEKLRLPRETVPCFRDLFDELHNLEAEFEDVVFDKVSFIDVRTEPITLKNVSLGRFAIRWHWPRLAAGVNTNCFDIIALDPNPATGKTIGETAGDFTGCRGVPLDTLDIEKHLYLEVRQFFHAITQRLEYLLPLINGVSCDEHGLLSMGKKFTYHDAGISIRDPRRFRPGRHQN